MVGEYEHPHVMIYESLDTTREVMPALHYAAQSSQPMLVVAAYFSPDVIRSLVLSRLNGAHVAALRLSGASEERSELMEDLSLLTGATIVRAGAKSTLGHEIAGGMGHARRFVQNANRSILLSTFDQERVIQQQIGFMHDTARICGDVGQRRRLTARLARLAECAVLIRLSERPAVEEFNRLRRFSDALNAARAGLAEGVVAGGGVALLRAAEVLPQRAVYRDGFEAGMGAVRTALEAPVRQLCENIGLAGAPVVAVLRSRSGLDLGVDVRTGEYAHMFAAGILDASRIVRSALTCAGTVASLLLAAGAIAGRSAS